MNNLKFVPEGWNNETTKLTKENWKNYKDRDETLQGIVSGCDDNYNLYIKFENGLQGKIPREEVEAIKINESGIPKENLCVGKVHKFVQFKIKDIDNENELILSRKQVQNEAIDWIKQDLKEGQKVDGIVKNIKPYGAFVEIGGGIVGLIHIEDLSVARIQTPYERLKVGQKAQVMVKSINRKQGKITLSYKELLGTWEENAKNFKEGMTVKGIVRETEKNQNGIFVELTPNLVGMTEYTEGLQYGQEVDVYIRKIDYDKKKVKLAVINNYL